MPSRAAKYYRLRLFYMCTFFVVLEALKHLNLSLTRVNACALAI